MKMQKAITVCFLVMTAISAAFAEASSHSAPIRTFRPPSGFIALRGKRSPIDRGSFRNFMLRYLSRPDDSELGEDLQGSGEMSGFDDESAAINGLLSEPSLAIPKGQFPLRGKKNGFAAFRGKKSDDSLGFSAFRGKKAAAAAEDDYYGFSGFRGRRSEHGFSAFRGKKGADGFVGFRGKKPSGFVGMRGKRGPDSSSVMFGRNGRSPWQRIMSETKRDGTAGDLDGFEGPVNPASFIRSPEDTKEIQSFLASLRGALVEPDFEMHNTDPATVELMRRNERSPLGANMGYLTATQAPQAARTA